MSSSGSSLSLNGTAPSGATRDHRTVRITRKEPLGMEAVIRLYIRAMGLSTGMNIQRIFAAWDEVSGAAAQTTRKFVRDGVLYCTITSSVVRNALYFQRDTLIKAVNDTLSKDAEFDPKNRKESFIKSIVLR